MIQARILKFPNQLDRPPKASHPSAPNPSPAYSFEPVYWFPYSMFRPNTLGPNRGLVSIGSTVGKHILQCNVCQERSFFLRLNSDWNHWNIEKFLGNTFFTAHNGCTLSPTVYFCGNIIDRATLRRLFWLEEIFIKGSKKMKGSKKCTCARLPDQKNNAHVTFNCGWP